MRALPVGIGIGVCIGIGVGVGGGVVPGPVWRGCPEMADGHSVNAHRGIIARDIMRWVSHTHTPRVRCMRKLGADRPFIGCSRARLGEIVAAAQRIINHATDRTSSDACACALLSECVNLFGRRGA